MSESRARLNFERALGSRDLIGRAMAFAWRTRRVTADEAFALLVRRSRQTPTNLVEIAETVIATGAL